jgi:hypothetical protein
VNRKRKETNVPATARIRAPIVIVIAIVEIAGLIYFYDQYLHRPTHGVGALIGFLMLSLMTIALIVPYLWSDWLLGRQIKYFDVVIVVVLAPAALLRFNQGKVFQAVLNGVIALVVLIAILPRLLGPGNLPAQEKGEMTVETAENQQSPLAIRPTGGRYFGLLLIWLVVMEISFSHAEGPIPFWLKALFMLPALWLTWESILRFSEGMKDLRSTKATVRKANESGGRA